MKLNPCPLIVVLIFNVVLFLQMFIILDFVEDYFLFYVAFVVVGTLVDG
jgi:hypothetical protein